MHPFYIRTNEYTQHLNTHVLSVPLSFVFWEVPLSGLAFQWQTGSSLAFSIPFSSTGRHSHFHKMPQSRCCSHHDFCVAQDILVASWVQHYSAGVGVHTVNMEDTEFPFLLGPL